jgi:hypothetical protein
MEFRVIPQKILQRFDTTFEIKMMGKILKSFSNLTSPLELPADWSDLSRLLSDF